MNSSCFEPALPFRKLNVKSEVDYVTVFNQILFTFKTPFTGFFGS